MPGINNNYDLKLLTSHGYNGIRSSWSAGGDYTYDCLNQNTLNIADINQNCFKLEQRDIRDISFDGDSGELLFERLDGQTISINLSSLSPTGGQQVQADWGETDDSSAAYIRRKPDLFSGKFGDLEDYIDAGEDVEHGLVTNSTQTIYGLKIFAGGIAADVDGGQYEEVGNTSFTGRYGLNLNSNDVIGVGSIFFDSATRNGERIKGLTFQYGGKYDSLWAGNGILYFAPNRNIGFEYGDDGLHSNCQEVLHSGNTKLASDEDDDNIYISIQTTNGWESDRVAIPKASGGGPGPEPTVYSFTNGVMQPAGTNTVQANLTNYNPVGDGDGSTIIPVSLDAAGHLVVAVNNGGGGGSLTDHVITREIYYGDLFDCDGPYAEEKHFGWLTSYDSDLGDCYNRHEGDLYLKDTPIEDILRDILMSRCHTENILVITANDLTMTYDGQEHTIGYSEDNPYGITVKFNGTDVTGESLITTTGANARTDAGTTSCSVNAEYSYDGNTYRDSTTVSLRIEKAPLTVEADDKSISLNEPLPTFTYTMDGFVNGETEESVRNSGKMNGSPVFNCGANTSVRGTYGIYPAVGSLTATNYYFIFQSGTLTVGEALVEYTNNGNETNPSWAACHINSTDSDDNPILTENTAYIAEFTYNDLNACKFRMPDDYELDEMFVWSSNNWAECLEGSSMRNRWSTTDVSLGYRTYSYEHTNELDEIVSVYGMRIGITLKRSQGE